MLTVSGLPGCEVDGNLVLRAFAAVQARAGSGSAAARRASRQAHSGRGRPRRRQLPTRPARSIARSRCGALDCRRNCVDEVALELGADVPVLCPQRRRGAGNRPWREGRAASRSRRTSGLLLVTPPIAMSTAARRSTTRHFDELGARLALRTSDCRRERPVAGGRVPRTGAWRIRAELESLSGSAVADVRLGLDAVRRSSSRWLRQRLPVGRSWRQNRRFLAARCSTPSILSAPIHCGGIHDPSRHADQQCARPRWRATARPSTRADTCSWPGRSAWIPRRASSSRVASRPQTERVLRNLTAVLEAAGLTMSDVVKTTCFLARHQRLRRVQRGLRQVHDDAAPRALDVRGGSSAQRRAGRNRGDRRPQRATSPEQ